jgi:succinate dehydrogenase / fumarate reductase, membrane anchor subunit
MGAPQTPSPQMPSETPSPEVPEPVVAQRIGVSPVSRGRVRPAGSGRELVYWYLMRVTGVALFVLALAHFSILHFIWDPGEQTSGFIANERWNQIFWRGFDWLLLMTVLFHGFLGVRTVIIDYARRETVREFALLVLYVLGVFLFAIGTQVILTLPVPGAT